MAKEVKKEEKKKEEFKLPQYLRLDKGSMWFDVDGENASGVKLFATKTNFIGRETILETVRSHDGKKVSVAKVTDVPKDSHGNKNINDFGKIESELTWYIDTTKIPHERLSRILLAYKHGILVEVDPNNPPQSKTQLIERDKDFSFKDNGERIFSGKNKEMYMKLQNNNFDVLRKFITSTPKTNSGKQNLIDLFDYEKKGYNPLNRARLEVLDLIKTKLAEFGPGMSSIRINEEE